MKSVILLATAIFLVIAPAPDSRDIAEMTSNFIVPERASNLQAADSATSRSTASGDLSSRSDGTDQSEVEKPLDSDESPTARLPESGSEG